MINGSDKILYILIDEIYKPIACLTSNSFNETVDLLETTTRQSEGWKTSRANLQSFNVDFEAIQDNDKTSYEELKFIKRNIEVRNFKTTDLEGRYTETFKGIIKDLSESAVVEEMISFSGLIEGYGKPITTIRRVAENWIFLDGNNFTTTQGDSLQFID